MNAVCIPRERITRQPIELSRFKGHSSYTMGFVNLNLTRFKSQIRATHKFHVIDSLTSYHQLLGRPWIHRHKAVPLPTISVWKSCRKENGFTSTPSHPVLEGRSSFLAGYLFWRTRKRRWSKPLLGLKVFRCQLGKTSKARRLDKITLPTLVQGDPSKKSEPNNKRLSRKWPPRKSSAGQWKEHIFYDVLRSQTLR